MLVIKYTGLSHKSAKETGPKTKESIKLAAKWLPRVLAAMNDQHIKTCAQMIAKDFDHNDLQFVLIFFGKCLRYCSDVRQILKLKLIQIIQKDIYNLKQIIHLCHFQLLQLSGKAKILDRFDARLEVYKQYKIIQQLSKIQTYDYQVLRLQSELDHLKSFSNPKVYSRKQNRFDWSANFFSQLTNLLKGYNFLISSNLSAYVQSSSQARLLRYFENIQRELLELEKCRQQAKRYECKQISVVAKVDQMMRQLKELPYLESQFKKHQTNLLKTINLKVEQYLDGLDRHLQERVSQVESLSYNRFHSQSLTVCGVLSQMCIYATIKQSDSILVQRFEKWKAHLVTKIPEQIQTIITINSNVQFISNLFRFQYFKTQIMSVISQKSNQTTEKLKRQIRTSLCCLVVVKQEYQQAMQKLKRLSVLKKGLMSHAELQQHKYQISDYQSSIASEIQQTLSQLLSTILHNIKHIKLSDAKAAIDRFIFYQRKLQKMSRRYTLENQTFSKESADQIQIIRLQIRNLQNYKISAILSKTFQNYMQLSIPRYTSINQFTIDQSFAQFFQLFEDKEKLKALITITFDKHFKKYSQSIQEFDRGLINIVEDDISAKILLLPKTLRSKYQLQWFQRKRQAIVQAYCLNAHNFKRYLQSLQTSRQKSQHQKSIFQICEHKLANSASFHDLFFAMKDYLRWSYEYQRSNDIKLLINNCLAGLQNKIERIKQQFSKSYHHYPKTLREVFEKFKQINIELTSNQFEFIQTPFNNISKRIKNYFVDLIKDHRNRNKDHLEWINTILSTQKAIYRKKAIVNIKNASLQQDTISQIQIYFKIAQIPDESSTYSQVLNPMTYQLKLKWYLIISNLQQMEFDTLKMRTRTENELQTMFEQWSKSFNFIKQRQNWILLVQHFPTLGDINTFSSILLRAKQKIATFLSKCQKQSKNKHFKRDKDLKLFLLRLLKVMKNKPLLVDDRTLNKLFELLQLDQVEDIQLKSNAQSECFGEADQQLQNHHNQSNLILAPPQESRDQLFERSRDSIILKVYQDPFEKTVYLSQTKFKPMKHLAFCNHYQLIKSLSKHSKKHIAIYQEPAKIDRLDNMIQQLPQRSFQLQTNNWQQKFVLKMEHGQDEYSKPSNTEEEYRFFVKDRHLNLNVIESAANFLIELEDLGIYHADIYLRNTIIAQNGILGCFKVIDFDYAFQFKVSNQIQSQASLNITKAMFQDIIIETKQPTRLYKIRYIFQSDIPQHKSIWQVQQIIDSQSQNEEKIQRLIEALQDHAIERHFQQFYSIVQELMKQHKQENQKIKVEQLLTKLQEPKQSKRYDYKQFAVGIRKIRGIQQKL